MAPRWVLTVALVADQVDADAVPVTTHQQPTRAQLQAKACICCGGEDGELVPAGHYPMETQPGAAPLGWAVAAHRKCLEGES